MQVSPGRSRRWALFALFTGITAVALTASLLYRLGPPGRAPLPGAVRVASAQGWQRANPSRRDQITYFWLSPHELLVFTGANRRSLQAIRYDTRTGRQTPLPALTRELRTARLLRMLDVSPNGRWLLWADKGARPPRPVVTAIDGTQTFRWPQGWHNTSLAWLPDSSGWVRTAQTRSGPSIQTYRIGSRRADYVPIAGGHIGFPLGITPQGYIITISGDDLTMMDSGEVFPPPVWLPPHAMKSNSPYAASIRLPEFNPLEAMPLRLWGSTPTKARITRYRLSALGTRMGAGPRRREFSVNLPARLNTTTSARHAAAALSPDGTRIAWLLYSEEVAPPLEQWTARMLSPVLILQRPPRYRLHLYISNADGTGMRAVGHVDVPRGDRSRSVLRWTPDGKRLSFVYNHALWTVPAR